MKMLIIADDITGAADTAAPFAVMGSSVDLVIPAIAPLGNYKGNPDVLAVSTETRDADALSVYEYEDIVQALIETADNVLSPAYTVYKKIDSTLRGHIECELTTLSHLYPDRLLVVCPAFPEMGRCVVDGQLINSRLPNAEHVPVGQRLGRLGETAVYLTSEQIRSGAASATIARYHSDGSRIVICDTETPEDLRQIAVAVDDNMHRVLPVASGGLARAIANVSELVPNCTQVPVGHLLALIGSRNAVSRQQAFNAMLDDEVSAYSNIQNALDALTGAQRARCAIIVGDMKEQEAGATLAKMLAGSEEILCHANIVLFATGGDTAMHMLSRIPQAMYLKVLGEYAPGIPICEIQSEHPSQTSSNRLLLKSGGFGDLELLRRICKHISGEVLSH